MPDVSFRPRAPTHACLVSPAASLRKRGSTDRDPVWGLLQGTKEYNTITLADSMRPSRNYFSSCLLFINMHAQLEVCRTVGGGCDYLAFL